MPHANPLARKAYQHAYNQAHREKRSAQTKEYKRVNREHINKMDRESAQRRRAERPEEHRLRDRTKARAYREARKGQLATKWRRYGRKFLYGLSHEAFEALLASQDHACPGCTAPLTETSACVDHDHATAHVRGLLCRVCNLAVGHAQDNPETLRRLAAYLERN